MDKLERMDKLLEQLTTYQEWISKKKKEKKIEQTDNEKEIESVIKNPSTQKGQGPNT